MTIADLSAEVRRGARSAEDVVGECLHRIAASDGQVRAFLSVDRQGALARAAEVDARVASGGDPGPLAGVPVAAKDNFAVQGMPLTCGSRILEGYASPYDATTVARLVAAGAVVVGKTNMDEFAMGSSTEHSGYGPTANPWDAARVPGGSSGGSAAALALGLLPAALGTDTGGSVRQPASFCGVCGLKPTYGRLSRYGVVAFASSEDCPGPMARSVEDVARLYTVMAGHDPRDATSLAEPVECPLAGLEAGVEGLRIGVLEELPEAGVDPDVRAAVDGAVARLVDAGAELRPVTLPLSRLALAVHSVIANAEASTNLARYDGVRYGLRGQGESFESVVAASRGAGFGREVKRRIVIGTFVLSERHGGDLYRKAMRGRAQLTRQLEAAFEQVHLLVGPTAPTTAFPFGSKLDDPMAMYRADALTLPASLAGVPALSVPCGVDRDGMPVGLQLTGPRLSEALLLRAGRAVEGAQPGSWSPRRRTGSRDPTVAEGQGGI